MLNKKGISGIVMTIIMIGLVLVAAGIVWTVVSKILQNQASSIDIKSKCMGIIITPTSLICEDGECNVTIERGLGSASEPIDGVEVIVTDDSGNTNSSGALDMNVLTSKKITITTDLDAVKADVRIYFKDKGENKFCDQIGSYP